MPLIGTFASASARAFGIVSSESTGDIEYLGVASGGNGGATVNGSAGEGGGGGGGELKTGMISVQVGDTIGVAFSGGDLILSGPVLSGTLDSGGAGGVPLGSGANGGSGGGGGNAADSNGGHSTAAFGVGFDGAPGTATGAPFGFGRGGGGGGAGGVGTTGTSGSFGQGGPGITSSINGTSVEYAQGGNSGDGVSGTTAGSGGGGGFGPDNTGAGNGLAGVFIVAYVTGTMTATGGTISTVIRPGWTVHTFTSDGTFTVTG